MNHLTYFSPQTLCSPESKICHPATVVRNDCADTLFVDRKGAPVTDWLVTSGTEMTGAGKRQRPFVESDETRCVRVRVERGSRRRSTAEASEIVVSTAQTTGPWITTLGDFGPRKSLGRGYKKTARRVGVSSSFLAQENE